MNWTVAKSRWTGRAAPPRMLGLSGVVLSFLLTGCTSLKSGADEIRPLDPDGGPADTDDAGESANDAGANDAGATPSDADSDASASAAASDESDAAGDEAGPSSNTCRDSQGFSGLGCYTCPPEDLVTLENACSDVDCAPFDNDARLSKLLLDGGLPALPQPDADSDAGASQTADAGTSTGASAGKSCSEVAALGKPVYVTGSSAVKPFLQAVARQFAASGVYIIYTSTGSCIGVDAIVNGTPMTTGSPPSPAAHATYWDSPVSEGQSCDLPVNGVVADLGISDVFMQSCPGFEVAMATADRVRDAHGPIQTMAFVVPANSDQTEISAQAAYFVYGFGKDGGVLDKTADSLIWSDEEQILQRQPASGTQSMLAAAIGVPAGRWKGKRHRTSDELVTSLLAASAGATSANQTIGILGADYIDSKNLRAQLRVLAFRDTQQACAVYPDSTQNSHDRRNVRDGHYPLWGPLHLLHRVNEDQLPANAENRQEVSDVMAYLSGTKALPNGVKLIDVYAQSGLIPECAMRVTRTKDGGNITPGRPDFPCACLFEERATGSTDCTPCKVQGDCASEETCSNGYCEP